MKSGVIVSASDKSLFDALNQRTVTNNDLRELFLTRGIIGSKDTSRRALALHFSRIPHDYHDYSKLATIFGNPLHHEKLTSRRLQTKADLKVLESSAHELKADLESEGSLVRISTSKGSRLDIEVQYQKLNFNKSEFRQVITKTVRITLEKNGDEIVAYLPHNDEAYEWMEKIQNNAQLKTDEIIESREIKLPLTLDAKAKSKFFIELVQHISGHPLHDVTDIYISKPTPDERKIESDGSVDSNDVSNGIHISKASLKGQGVLQSEEMNLLEKKGFYISKIVWTSKSTGVENDLFEFEAQFAKPETCSSFTFLPRGFYKKLGDAGHSLSRTGVSTEEEHRLGRLIEKSAQRAFSNLMGSEDGKDQASKT